VTYEQIKFHYKIDSAWLVVWYTIDVLPHKCETWDRIKSLLADLQNSKNPTIKIITHGI
jgi:hypothetical protein